MPDASDLFEPLEKAIRDQLIPALVGREVSDAERQVLALPLRHGGLGLTDPRETAKTEYKHSTQITAKLTAKIYTQKLDLDYNPSDQKFTRHTKNRIRQEKNAKCKNIRDELLAEMTPESQQLIKGAMEKGASSWLSALPIKAIGYALNKQEFTDAICMRYWMEGERHTQILCLWRDKFCRSQPHMQTGWIHFNEAQLSERL